ncbi:cytidylate kinase-like family protein [bacterium]|jgi:cytidylate kinase|nr:cytidylate kinase-like family protein [bacterium]
MTTRSGLSPKVDHYLRSYLASEARKEKEKRLAITLSRESGIDVETIGRLLTDYLDEVTDNDPLLNWVYLNRNLVEAVIDRYELPKTVTPHLLEKTKFPVTDALEEQLQLHPSEWTLFHYTAATIRNLCRHGNVVVVGRGGNFVTFDLSNTFHVRLVGDEQKRAEQLAGETQRPIADALKLVKSQDRERAAYVKRYTGSAIADPKFYHLTLCIDNFEPSILAHIIADSLLEWHHGR